MKKNKKQKVIPRFWWIASAYVLLLACIMFVRYYNPNLMNKWDFVVWSASFGLTGWLFFDEDILQSGKYFFFSVILSLIHLIFAQIVLHDVDTGIFKDLSMQQPLLLLVFQFPMRIIFIAIMEREPSTDRSSNTWQDKIYSMIILSGSFLPLILNLINKA